MGARIVAVPVRYVVVTAAVLLQSWFCYVSPVVVPVVDAPSVATLVLYSLPRGPAVGEKSGFFFALLFRSRGAGRHSRRFCSAVPGFSTFCCIIYCLWQSCFGVCCGQGWCPNSRFLLSFCSSRGCGSSFWSMSEDVIWFPFCISWSLVRGRAMRVCFVRCWST